MRATSRVLAAVRSASKYLEPNIPTGLTGLSTHPNPRPALIYTYKQTLSKLAQIPASSVYRQSAEALTKQRLEIVESTKPEGYEAWLERVRQQIEANPAAYAKFVDGEGNLSSEKLHIEHLEPWDGEVTRNDAFSEGTNTQAEAEAKAKAVDEELQEARKVAQEGHLPTVEDLEVEPQLTRAQIDEIEQKIGAGLIEEVVQVAEGELQLVDEMVQYRVWEDLVEQSPPGQWVYFERGDRV
ncbi:hypothetical protein B0A52_09314 [Exophiala mesophila]|uniref:Uncharacterized protein n=1 Tax=Exophiala mesophila TaxID=212818 RepID=A0A438MU66_EXOME|nr:hypothetical protein B0A52_09314 [Exophiala mesophila]